MTDLESFKMRLDSVCASYVAEEHGEVFIITTPLAQFKFINEKYVGLSDIPGAGVDSER